MGKLTHPGNLIDLTPEQRDEWHAKIRAAAAELGEKNEFSNDDIAYSRELVAWAGEVTDYQSRQSSTDSAAAADAARAGLAALSTDDETPDTDDDTDTAAEGAESAETGETVMRAVDGILSAVADRIRSETPAPAPDDDSGDGGSAPSVAELAGAGVGNGSDLPESEPAGPVMVAAADYGEHHTGQTLATRNDLARAVGQRVESYAQPSIRPGNDEPILKTPVNFAGAAVMQQIPGGYTRTPRVQAVSGGHQRHRVARIKRDDFAEFGTNPEENRTLALATADDWARQLRAGRTAAMGGVSRDTLIAAWCGPSERWDDLCERWSLDGQLPLPTRNVPRGSVEFATGYDFADVYDAIGENTADCAELEAGVTKTCVEVPCADTEEACLNADWLCLTADLLQRRSWPESIESFLSAALAAKAHKTNARIIAAMVAASTGADGTTIGDGATPTVAAPCDGDDAFASFLAAVELAIADMSYRAYMSMSGEFEVAVPAWVLPQLRAAVSRRRCIDDPVKADAWMQAQFAKIGATVHFVYGWQDAHVTTPPTGLPGGAVPLTELPTDVDFLVYPAGTWVKGINPVIELDTIYDSAGLQTNSFTALFVEDGWAAIKLCPYSRVYTASVDPCGCGCAAAGS